jgi:aquaporin Z
MASTSPSTPPRSALVWCQPHQEWPTNVENVVETETVPSRPARWHRLGAEAVGTGLLVVAGVGGGAISYQAIDGAGTNHGVGILGVALAVGISIIAGVLVFGPTSGAHFNPAVTVAIAASGDLRWKEVPEYVAAQIVGGAAGASLVAFLLMRSPGLWETTHDAGFGANGYGAHSPANFDVVGVLVAELVMTAVLVLVVLVSRRRGTITAAFAIGLTVVLLCVVTIPVDNASLNPARSLAAAMFGQPWAWEQLWAFVLAPLAAGVTVGALFGRQSPSERVQRVASA